MDDRKWTSDHVWLVGIATLAPLTAALSICSLFVFHSYRHRWRTLDLFLVTLTAQQLIVASLYFGRAVVSLTSGDTSGNNIRATSNATCPLLVWACLSLRTFQITTLTSMVLDRALAFQWPYKYRLSVRRSQVRYHIVVLAIVSILVGIASTFAKRDRVPSLTGQTKSWTDDDNDIDSDVASDGDGDGGNDETNDCLLMPIFLAKKFVVFIVFLHGLSTVISIIGLIHVTVKLTAARRRSISSPSPSLRVDHVRLPSSFTSSALQHRALQLSGSANLVTSWSSSPILRASCSSLRRSMATSTSCPMTQTRIVRRHFRFNTVIFVVIACNIVNHVPYLAMMIMGRWFDLMTTTIIGIPIYYYDSVSTCLALLEGLIVLPVILWAIDPVYKTAVTNSFLRISNRTTGKSPSTDYFNSERLEVDTFSGLESLSCSTLPHRNAIGFSSSEISTYSSGAFVCNSTLDKKVLLANHTPPRRWTSDEFDRSAPTSMTINDLAMKTDDTYSIESQRSYQFGDKMNFITKVRNKESEEHIYATLVSMTTSEKDVERKESHGMTDEDESPEMDLDDDDSSSFTTSASDDFEFHLTRPNQPPPLSPHSSFQDIFQWGEVRDFNTSPSCASTMSISSTKNWNSTNSLSKKQKRASLSMNDLDLLDLPIDDDTDSDYHPDDSDTKEKIVYLLADKRESSITWLPYVQCGNTMNRPLLQSRSSSHVSGGIGIGITHHHHSANNVSRPKRHQYLKNPLLLRGRFTNNRLRPPLPACNGLHYGGNWKYRPTVLPRQDFPWRKSPTQPFQVNPTTTTSSANDYIGPPSYRKTFISDFL